MGSGARMFCAMPPALVCGVLSSAAVPFFQNGGHRIGDQQDDHNDPRQPQLAADAPRPCAAGVPNDIRVKCPYSLSSFLQLSQQAGTSAR